MENSVQNFTIIKYQTKNLLVILIDSVFRTIKNHYPQVLLEKCKYVVKGKSMSECITNDLEIPHDSDRKDSDEENSNAENSDEEN